MTSLTARGLERYTGRSRFTAGDHTSIDHVFSVDHSCHGGNPFAAAAVLIPNRRITERALADSEQA